MADLLNIEGRNLKMSTCINTMGQRHDIDTRELNCAARFHGVSLNGCLLSGPNLANTITGTLLRFRHHGIAIIGYIESRFYQVRVPEKDRDLQRFLWFENGDPRAEPIEYRMTVHICGSTSSTSCTNFALQYTAMNERVISTKTLFIQYFTTSM